jgi:hypothetical protein
MAIVSSLRMFDREQRKEFLVPIVIKDSGNPAMSGTSTLTVIIGDTNVRNKHKTQKINPSERTYLSNGLLYILLGS